MNAAREAGEGMKLLSKTESADERSCACCNVMHEMILCAQDTGSIAKSVETYFENLSTLAELTQKGELTLYAAD